MIWFCEKCYKDNVPPKGAGYRFRKENDPNICLRCTVPMKESTLSDEEFSILLKASTDPKFIKLMDDLKEKDPIEFQIKLNQLRMTQPPSSTPLHLRLLVLNVDLQLSLHRTEDSLW